MNGRIARGIALSLWLVAGCQPAPQEALGPDNSGSLASTGTTDAQQNAVIVDGGAPEKDRLTLDGSTGEGPPDSGMLGQGGPPMPAADGGLWAGDSATPDAPNPNTSDCHPICLAAEPVIGLTCDNVAFADCHADCAGCGPDEACNRVLPGETCLACRSGAAGIVQGDRDYGTNVAGLSDEQWPGNPDPRSVAFATFLARDVIGAREIVGDLTIRLADVTTADLAMLSCLRKVHGRLEIYIESTEPAPYSLHGLEALEEVGGDFKIYSTAGGTPASEPVVLTSLTPLRSLRRVGGQLEFSGLGAPDLDGLQNLQEVGGLRLTDSWHLKSLVGIEQLSNIAGSIDIWFTSINSLSPLANASGFTTLRLGYLPYLASLAGGPTLPAELESMVLSNLPELANAEALAPVTGIGDLELINLPRMDTFPLPALRSVTESAYFARMPIPNFAGAEVRGVRSLVLYDLDRLEAADLGGVGAELDALVVAVLPRVTGLPLASGLQTAQRIQLTGLDALASLEDLAALRSVGTLTLDHLPQLGDLDDLTALEAFTAPGVASLAYLPQLKDISRLRGTTGLQEILANENASLPQCQVLDLSLGSGAACGCSQVGDYGAAAPTPCNCDLLCACTGNENLGPVCL